LYAKEAVNAEVVEIGGTESWWSLCCEDHQLCARRFTSAQQGSSNEVQLLP